MKTETAFGRFFIKYKFLVRQRLELARMDSEIITMRYGVILISIDKNNEQIANFNMAMGMEIAERLDMRLGFINCPLEKLFAGFDIEYDMAISSLPVSKGLQLEYNLSKPFIMNPMEPGLYSIVSSKENEKLTLAVNKTLEAMFADGTVRKISMNTLGMDLVTQARQAW